MSFKKAVQTVANPNPLGIHAGPSLAELNRRQAEIDKAREGYPRVEVGAERIDKQIKSMDDEARELIDPYTASDPMEEVAGPYKRAGFALKFISDAVTRVQGTRGYKAVLDSRGEPVKMGTLTLAEIPARVADMRRQKAVSDSASHVSEIENDYQASVERLKGDAKDMGLKVLNQAEVNEVRGSGHGGIVVD